MFVLALALVTGQILFYVEPSAPKTPYKFPTEAACQEKLKAEEARVAGSDIPEHEFVCLDLDDKRLFEKIDPKTKKHQMGSKPGEA